MPVRARLHLKGSGLHFVTTTVVDWLPIFSDSDIAIRVLKLFSEACELYRASVVGYVLMPSHLHALVGMKESERLSQLMRSFKALSSKLIKESISAELLLKLSTGGGFTLWQPRFDELTIFSERQFRIKLEYIHNNPVKDGLVTNAVDYPFSSARDWLMDEQGYIPVDRRFDYQC